VSKKFLVFSFVICGVLSTSISLQAMGEQKEHKESAELQVLVVRDGGAQGRIDDEQKAPGAVVRQPVPVVKKDQWGYCRSVGNSNVVLTESTLWQFMPLDTQDKLRRMYSVEWLNNASQCLSQYNNPACKELLESLKREADQKGGNQVAVKACQAAYLKEFITQLPDAHLWKLLKQENKGLLETDNSTQELQKNTETLCRNNDPRYCQFLLAHLMPEQENERDRVESRDSLETRYVLALMKEKNKAINESAAQIQKERDWKITARMVFGGSIIAMGMLLWPIINAGICSSK
jgi:hypothetical protein